MLLILAKQPFLRKPTCKTKVDVGFILDSSGSLKNEYGKEKDFLKALAATFGVSSVDGKAGVVTFSYDSEHSIKLNDHTSLTSFYEAVDKIALMGSTTRIDKALRTTQKEMFTIANGGRPGAGKLLVLLTDGSQTQDSDAEDPAIVAEELRQEGVRLLVVGIGKGVNPTELARIAGDRSKVFTASSFDELLTRDFLNDVNSAGCKAGSYIPFSDFKSICLCLFRSRHTAKSCNVSQLISFLIGSRKKDLVSYGLP